MRAGVPARAPALHFERVSKRYRADLPSAPEVLALADVDLQVPADSSVGVIGPNGAGKSTLLKLAAGITGPSSGRIVRPARTTSVIELGAGIHPDLTGLENLELLSALTTDAIDAGDISAMIEFSGLGADIDARVRHYSTGMIARLSFAVAVHTDAELLLVDEVLSVGDLEFQRRCRGRIRELRSQGVSLLLATHDLDLVTDLCDRAVLLVGGRVERDGDAAAVVRHYEGRPDPAPPEGSLALELESTVLPPEGPLVAHMALPPMDGPARVHFEYVVEMHPEVKATGQSASLVCGITELDLEPSRRLAVELQTEGLPRGRYELHTRVENPRGEVVSRRINPFDILGPSGIDSVRISATSRLDGTRIDSRH